MWARIGTARSAGGVPARSTPRGAYPAAGVEAALDSVPRRSSRASIGRRCADALGDDPPRRRARLRRLRAGEVREREARLDDLEQLSQFALRYDDVGVPRRGRARERDRRRRRRRRGDRGRESCSSSVHQAKGLEWRVVFVIWLAGRPVPLPLAARRGGRGGGAAALLRRRHARQERARALLPAGRPRPHGLA